MRNHCDDIKNEIAYFYTVIKNMNTKDDIKESKIKEHELPLDEIIYDNFSDDFDMDKQIAEQILLGWIYLIDNKKLHKAVKSLSIEYQIFISYIVKDFKTQREKESCIKLFGYTKKSRLHKSIYLLKSLLQKLYPSSL